MKINLTVDSPGLIRSGYLNIDTFPQNNMICAQPDNLNEYVDDNEATEIIAQDVISYYSIEDTDRVISHLISKLAHKGKLTISAVDIREVSRAVVMESISLKEINNLLHDKIKLSTHNMANLERLLESKGMKILYKNYSNYRAIITAERQ